MFSNRANLQESFQGTGDLRERRSSARVGRSPLDWRNTWTRVHLTKLERLDTSSSHLSSLPACRPVGSATSEAISWRRAQNRQSLQTLSNPCPRPSSCWPISQVIAGSSCFKMVPGKKLNFRPTLEMCWEWEWGADWGSRPLEEVPPAEQNPRQSPSVPPHSCLARLLLRTGKREELSPVPLPNSLRLH